MKRTSAHQEAILEALRRGATREAAAFAAGVDRVTAWRWTQDDPQFAAEVAQACGQAEVSMTQRVVDAAASDWRVAAWWLERRRPGDFGRNRDLSPSMTEMAEHVAAAEGIDVDELLREAESLMRRVG